MTMYALSKLNLIKNPRVFMNAYCPCFHIYSGCSVASTVNIQAVFPESLSRAPVPLQESMQFAVPCAYSYKIHLKTWPCVLKLTRVFTEEVPLLIVPGVRRLPWDF